MTRTIDTTMFNSVALFAPGLHVIQHLRRSGIGVEAGHPRSDRDSARTGHRVPGRQDPGLRHELILVQHHGAGMNSRNDRHMDSRDHLCMDACENDVMNARHHMHPHDWLHSRDGHNAVDVAHIARPHDVPVTYFVDVAIRCSSDVAVAAAGDIAIAIDVADLRHRSEAVDRTDICAGDRLLAGFSDTLCRLS